MKTDEVIDSISTEYPWRKTLAIWEYIYIKTEQVPESAMKWLPYHQCPSSACGDIGQHLYKGDISVYPYGAWKFYCPYCHIHYYARYREEPLNTEGE